MNLEIKKLNCMILVGLIMISFNCQSQQGFSQENIPVNFSHVTINDSFWMPRLKTHAEVTLPACIYQSEVATNRIKNFAIAAGLDEGEFEGFVYDDSDVYKMIEGASYSLMNNPNPALEKKLDSIINLISKAQLPDGYLMTYFQLGDLSQRWTDMDKHEMYCCGHLIEAGIAFYEATGKRSLLDVAIKYADHIDRTFGEGKRVWVPGHPEIELALVKLYRATNDPRYLNLSRWLLEQRGHNQGTWNSSYKDYYLDSVPVKELKEAKGHAVRAMYLFTGMADVSSAMKDSTYIPALSSLWNDVVFRKMYITGGIGSSRANEGFTEPYDLPNKEAYCETCASVGMVFWNQRMNMLSGDGKYVDVLERSMYNGALAGISLSGDLFFYVNPLESDGDHHRKKWYGTACCPSQISRFLPSIGSYIYAVSPDKTLWINLYIGNEANIKIGNNCVSLQQETLYPWDGAVRLTVNPEFSDHFTLKLRIPGWCKSYSIKVNDKPFEAIEDLQYVTIGRKWEKGDTVSLTMDMPVEVVAADPRVKANVGKRAIQRGPLVYCLEEVDNPEIDHAQITNSTTYTFQKESNLLGSVVSITAKVDGNRTFKFIPYYAWDNRKPGKMKVWIKYHE